MQLQLTGLWRHGDFLKLWAGQTISLIGSKLTFLALPLTAVIFLEATPGQMGLLAAAETLPALLVSLFAGAWVDRARRRPIMIATDVGRGLLLLLIPGLALFGLLRIEIVYIIAFLVGVLSLFFETAYHAFLPLLVGRGQLVEANSKLELSRSAAEIVGPGLAGGLVQLVTAPVTLLVDGISFLISAFCLALIRTPEPPPKAAENQNIWRDIGDGLRLVLQNRTLRALAGCAGTIGLFNAMLEAISILYASRELGLNAGLLGFIFACGSVGFLLGALLPERAVRRFGLGPTIIAGLLLTAASDLLTPLAGGSVGMITFILTVGQLFFGLGLTLYSVGQVSLRQAVTPDPLLGRVKATMSFIGWGIVPLGGLLGGFLGETIGLRPTLFLAAFGEMAAVLWLVWSPVRGVDVVDLDEAIWR